MKIANWIRQVSAMLLAAALFVPAGFADEGMWTFDNPPLKLLEGEIQLYADAAMA